MVWRVSSLAGCYHVGMTQPHPFPYRSSTILVDLLTGDEIITLTDELDGIVAAKTPRADVMLFRHSDLVPAHPRYTASSYDATAVGEVST
jgi:hypothetical protein